MTDPRTTGRPDEDARERDDDRPADEREAEVEEQARESFPASDPPSRGGPGI